MYNLALSSKRFFTDASEAEAADGAAAEAPSASPTERLGSSSSAPATRMLRHSLLSSLGRVLEHSRSGITLESALALGNLPEGSALIAGSTIVQTCLGVLWEGNRHSPVDVDVFCSAKAAPKVRSWLVEEASCMFVGFRDTYIDMVDDRLLYAVDTKIHHGTSFNFRVMLFVRIVHTSDVITV